MRLVVNVHHKDHRTVVAVCDSAIIGQLFEDGELQLDLSGDFYRGDEYEDASIVGDLIRNADSVNLVGDEAIKLGLMEGVIDPDHVRVISGVPHAQAIILHE